MTRIAIALGVAIAAGIALAQQPGIKRTVLERVEVPNTMHEVVLGTVELAAGTSAGRHAHPGPETGTVMEGEIVLLIDGQPNRALKAGDSYQIAAGAVHDTKSASGGKVVAVYAPKRAFESALSRICACGTRRSARR
jgi:quercetin dioxygenase-like cupin family protein